MINLNSYFLFEASTLFRVLSAVAMVAALHTGIIAGMPSNDPPAGSGSESGASVAKQLLVEVNGRPLTGPFSSAERRGDKIFVPATSIARVLGHVLTTHAASQLVSVRRRSGQIAEVDLRTLQIRQDGAAVLSFSDISGVNIPQNAQELMLPLEWISALLDVSIYYDSSAKVVRVTSGDMVGTARIGQEHGALEIYNLEYEYNLNSYGSFTGQNLLVRSIGRIGSGRYSLSANAGTGAGSLFGPLRHATFVYEDASERKFMGGDVGTSGDVQFLATNLRGISAQIPFRGARVTAFGGRAASGVFPVNKFYDADGQVAPLRTGVLDYDTTVVGGYVTFGERYDPRPVRRQWLLSTGGMRFSAANRSGEIAAANTSFNTDRFRFVADAAVGRFKGERLDGTDARGVGYALDVSGSFDVTDDLAVQGRYTRISRNFLGPQSSLFTPTELSAAGVSWRPASWLSTSFYGSLTKRPENKGTTDRNFVATVNISPGGSKPTVYFSHAQNSTALLKKSSFTVLNISKDFSRFRAFVNASRVQAVGPAAINVQAGATIRVNERNSLLVTQGIGSAGSLSGTADWFSSGMFNNRLSFGAGVGYSRSNSNLTLSQRVSASIKLPRQMALQMTYSHHQTGPQLQLSVRGSLFNKKDSHVMMSSPVSEIQNYGSVSGRVYQDTNLNGRYDGGIDTPQPNVKIRIDGNLYATSDHNGIFRIENIKAGEHEAQIDLLSIRADLTILDQGSQYLVLTPGRDTIIDFRLVRTGRAAGLIWNDANENGVMDPGEEPLTDVRVVFGKSFDALTDENGVFTIGDLPPGEHVLMIDEKTLPAGYRARISSSTVSIAAGKETAGLKLAVVPAEAMVKVFN